MMSRPYKCPVCLGGGQVDHLIYDQYSAGGTSINTTPVTCRSCNGAGIVWGPKKEHRWVLESDPKKKKGSE